MGRRDVSAEHGALGDGPLDGGNVELDDEVNACLADASPERRTALAEEAADCYLLLLHIAHKCGFDLEMAAREKLERNRARIWGEPDGRGVVRHVE